MIPQASEQTLDTRLFPSFGLRVVHGLLTHSGHAPLTILILEWLLSAGGYFREPDAYVLLLAALGQAIWQASRRAEGPWGVMLGNLSGVVFYTALESLIEGLRFFQSPQHLAYWLIALAFAALQGLRARLSEEFMQDAVRWFENLVRAAIPVLLYAVFEFGSMGSPPDWVTFFADPAHLYLSIVVMLLGLLLGAADVMLVRTQRMVRLLAQRLHQFSSWSYGPQVLAAMLAGGNLAVPQRQERSVLFADLRGFTAWSERHAPEEVVAMLDRYYAVSEAALQGFSPLKVKYTADEVMAVFADTGSAWQAAQRLRKALAEDFDADGLQAGLGLNRGPVVEGLLGSEGVRAYEVIGDTVNTASRLCSVAAAGELLAAQPAVPEPERSLIGARQEVSLKGKRDPLQVVVIGG